jgi:transitional endoplasmic reticulum ATPase
MAVNQTRSGVANNGKNAQKREKDSAVNRERKEALLQLERLGGLAFREEDILYQGDKLILPQRMTLQDGINFLNDKKKEDEEISEFSRVFKYRPWDVAWCAFQAFQKHFGGVNQYTKKAKSFFDVDEPPQFIDIATGPNEVTQIPWGYFKLPVVPRVNFNLGVTETADGTVGFISAEGPKGMRFAVQGVFAIIEQELKTNSLYRGKAFDAQDMPNFLDLSSVDPDKIIYAQDVLKEFEASVWASLRHPEETKALGMPFKRAILLSGEFGTGKSLGINRTGQICEEEGITFILARPGRDDLRQALLTARMYQPAVVAYEDVDTVAGTSANAKKISEILDLFDGIEAKNNNVMLILTTNHVEKLHKGMLRPGRLDAIITIGAPDAEGIRKLIQVNIPPSQIADEINWIDVSDAMEGYLPAFVVEAAQRSMRYSLVREGGKARDAKITTEDLVYAANGLRPQWALMQDAHTETAKPQLEDAMGEVVSKELAKFMTSSGVMKKLGIGQDASKLVEKAQAVDVS